VIRSRLTVEERTRRYTGGGTGLVDAGCRQSAGPDEQEAARKGLSRAELGETSTTMREQTGRSVHANNEFLRPSGASRRPVVILSRSHETI